MSLASSIVHCLANSLRSLEELPSVGRVDAAVNIILRFKPRLSVLLIKRTYDPRDPWSGDIALPGGHLDKDETAIDAAYRETEEEVGIPSDALEPLGFLGFFKPLNLPYYRVIAIVSLLLSRFEAEPRHWSEVSATFWVPIEDLPQLNVITEDPRGRGFLVKAYILPGGSILWGMTRRIIDSLYRVLSECSFL